MHIDLPIRAVLIMLLGGAFEAGLQQQVGNVPLHLHIKLDRRLVHHKLEVHTMLAHQGHPYVHSTVLCDSSCLVIPILSLLHFM